MNKEHPTGPVYVTTAIPYVNAAPHIGFALELVQADVIARYFRQRGRDIRLQSGSDENSLKNLQAAERAGLSCADFVARHAQGYVELASALGVELDAFVRTSSDPLHRRGVAELWQACVANGDIYAKDFEGHYCLGCEQFYDPEDLPGGRCPEHGTLEKVRERNYFFRLSRYQDEITELLSSGRLRVTPDNFRQELLTFLGRGLHDFSISRPSSRARGFGIEVPGDQTQVIYVWFDALGNYLTPLELHRASSPLRKYWSPQARRVHVLGKGITRFHAIYWPAILLSAGLPPPTDIVVHGYLTVEGSKIGKSRGNAIDPVPLLERFGSDSFRYWASRKVRFGRDADFSATRFAEIHNSELADQLGNLLARTTSLIERYAEGRIPERPKIDDHRARKLVETAQQLGTGVERAYAAFRVDEALDKVWALIQDANAYVSLIAPWRLAKQAAQVDATSARDLRNEVSQCLYILAEVVRLVALAIWPTLPDTAQRIADDLGLGGISRICAADWRWGHAQPGTRVRRGKLLFVKQS